MLKFRRELGALKQCIYKTSVNLKGVCEPVCVCVKKHLLIRKMQAFVGALPSNASYQRLNTDECRADQCTASRLLIDTSDYLRIRRERESRRERWMDRKKETGKVKDRTVERREPLGEREAKTTKRGQGGDKEKKERERRSGVMLVRR